ncbi:MAG: fatty acid desaturase [Pseudomonadota bacterium]
MGDARGASHASLGPMDRAKREWPTWLALVVCYALWGLTVAYHPILGWWVIVPGAVLVAFHSSLQHEILHGHPTRSAALNEALVFPALGLFIPYRRFRDLHLKHHNDERLTDPFDDPESFYLAEADWQCRCGLMRTLLAANATLAGRMLIGPAMAMWGFWRSELRLIAGGDEAVRGAWTRHMLGVALVLAMVWWAGMAIWVYIALAAYPGMSLIMIRSFIEHRAAETAPQRTAVIEAGWFWRLLYLNNNYHSVHHAYPAMAWYLLPSRWRAEREHVLRRNGGYLLPGYGAVFRRWFLKGREPVIHPLLYRDDAARGLDER